MESLAALMIRDSGCKKYDTFYSIFRLLGQSVMDSLLIRFGGGGFRQRLKQ